MDVSLILQSDYFRLIVGFTVGAIIGLERQFTAEELGERMPGVRTFGLISLLGTMTVILAINFQFREALILGAIFVFILITLYSLFRFIYYVKDTGITTSVTLGMSYFLGILIGYNEIVLGITLSIFITFILAIKKTVTDILKNLEYQEIKSALTIGILSLLLLPLIPDVSDPFFGIINARIFFFFLVLVLFIGFLAYMALKKLGPTQGLITFAVIGSIINSEAVSVNMVRLYKEREGGVESNILRTVASGIMLANTTMIIRTLFLTAILAWNEYLLILYLTVALLLPISVGGVIVYLRFRNEIERRIQEIELKSPLSYGTAFKFSTVFAFIVFISVALENLLPVLGIFIGSFLGGLVSNAAVVLSVMSLYSAGKISMNTAIYSILFGTISAVINKLIYVKAEGANRKLMIHVLTDICILVGSIIAGAYILIFLVK